MKTIQELHFELAMAYVSGGRQAGNDKGCIALAEQNLKVWITAFPGLIDLGLKKQQEQPKEQPVQKTAKRVRKEAAVPVEIK